MHLEDLGAPLHCVTSDGAFENTVRPHLLLLWLRSLDQLSEVTGEESYRLAKERTLTFLEGGISDEGIVFSLYDPGYPPDGFSKAHWKWHPGDKIITDELLLSALGFYRLGKEDEARRVLYFVTQRTSGGFYAYLDPKSGGPSFVDAGPEYFDVVASSLVEKLALALGEESLSRSPSNFLLETQSANGGWFWGLTSDHLDPVEGKQASLINLWNGGEELPEFLVRYSRANWNSVALVEWRTP
jgi:hypothetical protein